MYQWYFSSKAIWQSALPDREDKDDWLYMKNHRF